MISQSFIARSISVSRLNRIPKLFIEYNLRRTRIVNFVNDMRGVIGVSPAVEENLKTFDFFPQTNIFGISINSKYTNTTYEEAVSEKTFSSPILALL